MYSIMTSGQVAIHHPDGCPLSDCAAVAVTVELDGTYLVTASGPRGVQTVVVGDIAAAARAAVTALAVTR